MVVRCTDKVTCVMSGRGHGGKATMMHVAGADEVVKCIEKRFAETRDTREPFGSMEHAVPARCSVRFTVRDRISLQT